MLACGHPAGGPIPEKLMLTSNAENPRTGYLRFVYPDTVVSFRIAGDVTFGEVARTMGELASQRYGPPLAIDVTLGARAGDTVFRA